MRRRSDFVYQFSLITYQSKSLLDESPRAACGFAITNSPRRPEPLPTLDDVITVLAADAVYSIVVGGARSSGQ